MARKKTASPAMPGARIRTLRRGRGITQKELAKIAGCSQQTILDLELGNVVWSRFLPAIAEALGVSLHWLETGSGPRDRPGANQGAVPVVQWEYFAQAALAGEPPPATDWLDGCPVRHTGSVVMVVADDATGFAMAERVAVGDWLFVDTARHNDGLVVVIMAGWQRAELRELTSAGGCQYLQTANPRLPDDVLAVQVHTRREVYAQALQTPRQERLPALVLGRVVFRGRPE